MLLLRQDSSGRWNQFSGRYAWDTSCICSGNPAYGGTGAEKQGSNFEAAPNVDHTSERVRRVRLRLKMQLSRAHAQEQDKSTVSKLGLCLPGCWARRR